MLAAESTAVRMRYTSAGYPEISKETGIAYRRVRKLFMAGGKLEAPLEEYRASQQSRIQKSADDVAEEVKQDMMNAYQRMRDLSENAETDAGSFKANEFILKLAGISSDVSLKTLISKLGPTKARSSVSEMFMDLFGEPFARESETAVMDLTSEQTDKLIAIAERNSLIYKELNESEHSK